MLRKLPILVFAVALIAAACGDDDEASATTAAPTTTAASTTTAAPATTASPATRAVPTTVAAVDEVEVTQAWWQAIAAGDAETALSLSAPTRDRASMVGFAAIFFSGEVTECKGGALNVRCTMRLDHPLFAAEPEQEVFNLVKNGVVTMDLGPHMTKILRVHDWAVEAHPEETAVCDAASYEPGEVLRFGLTAHPDFAIHPDCGRYLSELVPEYLAATGG